MKLILKSGILFLTVLFLNTFATKVVPNKISVSDARVQKAKVVFKELSKARRTMNGALYYSIFSSNEKQRFRVLTQTSSDVDAAKVLDKIVHQVGKNSKKELSELEEFVVISALVLNQKIILNTVSKTSKVYKLSTQVRKTKRKDEVVLGKDTYSLVFVLEDGKYYLDGKLGRDGEVVSFFEGKDAQQMIKEQL